MHAAAFSGEWHIARHLLELGAGHLTMFNSEGHLPADIAEARGHTELAALLNPPTVNALLEMVGCGAGLLTQGRGRRGPPGPFAW